MGENFARSSTVGVRALAAYPNPANRCPIWVSAMNSASRNTASYSRGCGVFVAAPVSTVAAGQFRAAAAPTLAAMATIGDPMFHLSLLRSLSLALGRVTAKAGARRSYSSAVVEEQLRCRVRATAYGADPCRSACEHRPAAFELGRREPDQPPQGPAVRWWNRSARLWSTISPGCSSTPPQTIGKLNRVGNPTKTSAGDNET